MDANSTMKSNEHNNLHFTVDTEKEQFWIVKTPMLAA